MTHGTGTPTGGTFTLTVQPYATIGSTTVVVPYNSTVAQFQAQLDPIFGVGNTIVTGTTLPGGSMIVTYKNELATQPVTAIVVASYAALTGGSTPTAVVTQTTPGVLNSGLFTAYASGNSDGSQVAKVILKYPCVSDANNNLTISGNIVGFSEPVVSAYYAGAFRSEELVGLDSAGLTNLGGSIKIGTLTSGVVMF